MGFMEIILLSCRLGWSTTTGTGSNNFQYHIESGVRLSFKSNIFDIP